ncbi:MAG: zf-HC2 domain-containing protein [Desulfurivibrionaceae bacterium]|nr:zf-HC2 domain-containing protein [Desulfurivibrionaceae bacterium]
MNCPDCQNQFSDFIDAAIPLNQARNLKEHLAACSECAAEWQLFQQTIHTLHSFPVQRVDADFLVGINEKLSPEPFAKLKGWLSFMRLHKLTATTALATLAVGVISAAVLQLSPVATDQNLAEKSSLDKNIVQAMAVDQQESDYYPGIPYLAQNTRPEPAPLRQPGIQFTPVNQSAPGSAHYPLLDPRGPPSQAPASFLHPSLSQLKSLAPDLVVTVHASSPAQQHTLLSQLTGNSNWQTQISGNALLVTLPCSQISSFQDLFGPAKPRINPHVLARLGKNAPSRLMTVAVAFQ